MARSDASHNSIKFFSLSPNTTIATLPPPNRPPASIVGLSRHLSLPLEWHVRIVNLLLRNFHSIHRPIISLPNFSDDLTQSILLGDIATGYASWDPNRAPICDTGWWIIRVWVHLKLVAEESSDEAIGIATRVENVFDGGLLESSMLVPWVVGKGYESGSFGEGDNVAVRWEARGGVHRRALEFRW